MTGMQPVRAIVAGIAELGGADPVLGEALALGRRLGAEVHLVHAYLPPAQGMALGGGTPDLVGMASVAPLLTGPELVDYADSMAERLRGEARAAGADEVTRYHVVAGPAAGALAEVAERVRADLIVVGASHRGRVERFFLGTTAGRTLRQARAPVLVLRGPLPAEGASVLLATDLSGLGSAACAAGLELARRLFAPAAPRFRCLTVGAIVHGDLPPGEVEGAVAREELARFVASLPGGGQGVEPAVRLGVPVDEIAAEAAAWPADLVVLGTHGRSGLSHLFLGSVAETAVRDVPCSALVIPAVALALE